jgi:hypothetical protein
VSCVAVVLSCAGWVCYLQSVYGECIVSPPVDLPIIHVLRCSFVSCIGTFQRELVLSFCVGTNTSEMLLQLAFINLTPKGATSISNFLFQLEGAARAVGRASITEKVHHL